MLTLHELTQPEFDEWFMLSTKRQAEDRAQVSGRSVADERKDLDAMIPHLLPEGKDSAGHVFRLARDGAGRAVAFVWFGQLPGVSESQRFLFDIYVVPEARRRGFGRDVLRAMMLQLSKEGVRQVALNVLDTNEGAIALYNDLGFRIAKRDESQKNLEMVLAL